MPFSFLGLLARRGKHPIHNSCDIGEEYLSYLEDTFRKADADSSGFLNTDELHNMWMRVFRGQPDKTVMRMTEEIHKYIDANNDGHVSWNELETFFRGGGESTEIDRLIQVRIANRAPTPKEVVWHIMEIDSQSYSVASPTWMPEARAIVSTIVNLTIIVSILSIVVESLPAYQDPDGSKGHGGNIQNVETACIATFTLELILRVASCPSQVQLWTSWLTWIDVLAIMPFYISITFGSNPSNRLILLRVLRLLRLVRMVKLGRSLECVQLLVIAVMRVGKALLVSMLGINIVLVTLFAALMFTVERDEARFDAGQGKWIRDNVSQYPDAGQAIAFQSIPASMWWAWVTLTTVGYGDMYPYTGAGKAVASTAILCGLPVMACPLTLLASSFADTMAELQQKKTANVRIRKFMDNINMYGRIPDGYLSRRALPGSACVGTVRQATGIRAHDRRIREGSRSSKELILNPLAAESSLPDTGPQSPQHELVESSPEGAASALSSLLCKLQKHKGTPRSSRGPFQLLEDGSPEPAREVREVQKQRQSIFVHSHERQDLDSDPRDTHDHEPLMRLSYWSRATEPMSTWQFRELGQRARQRNTEHEVTGYLVHSPPYFFQSVEGPPPAIAALEKCLRHDPRHRDFTVCERHTVSVRIFGDWTLEQEYIGEGVGGGRADEASYIEPLVRQLMQYTVSRGAADSQGDEGAAPRGSPRLPAGLDGRSTSIMLSRIDARFERLEGVVQRLADSNTTMLPKIDARVERLEHVIDARVERLEHVMQRLADYLSPGLIPLQGDFNENSPPASVQRAGEAVKARDVEQSLRSSGKQ